MHTVSSLARACKGFMVKPPKGRDMIPSDGYAMAMGVFTSNGYGAVTDGMVAVRTPVACQEDGWWSPDGRRIRDDVDLVLKEIGRLLDGVAWRHSVPVRRADLRAFCEAVVKLADGAKDDDAFYLITINLATGEIRYSMAPYTLVQHVHGLALPPSAGIEPFTVTLDARLVLHALAPLKGSVVRMEFTKHQLGPVVFRGDALTCAIVAAVRV